MAEPTQPKLYHYELNSSCMQVRMALSEKGIDYKRVRVFHPYIYCYEPWFLKINPAAQVPVLDTGTEIICDTKDIIPYLDKAYPDTVQLLPSDDSPESKQVIQLHRKLADIDLDILKYGSMHHPELTSRGNLKLGLMEKFIWGYIKSIKKEDIIMEYARKYPELKLEYLDKLPAAKVHDEDIRSRERIQFEVRKLADVYAEIEIILSQKIDNQICSILPGKFTMADITLAVTMERVERAGFATQTWQQDKYPHLQEYYNNTLKRPSFVQECYEPSLNAFRYFVLLLVKRKLLPIVAYGVVIGVAATAWVFKDKICEIMQKLF